MELEHLYRDECDTQRILADEFERMYERYVTEHRDELNSIEAHDAFEYRAPRCIANLKSLLSSSLLVQSQGLLDFRLPTVVKLLANGKPATITPFDKSWKRGNVLDWVKCVLKDELHSTFNFGTERYRQLKAFYDIRNDQVHHGGYLSVEQRRILVNSLNGVRICNLTDLYDIDFSYCKSVINHVEAFLIEVQQTHV